VSGTGASCAGAIINSASQTGVVSSVTLASDTTFGGGGDWGISSTNDSVAGAILSSQGKRFNLAKTGSNAVALRSVNVDSALGDIDIEQGTLSLELATTSLGDSGRTITVEPGASLALRDCVNPLNKQLALNGDGLTWALTNASGSNILTGPMVLDGDCGIGVGTGTLVLAAAAAAIGAFRRRGPWIAALFGALLGASTLLVAPSASAFPLVACAWLSALVLAAEPARPRRPSHLVARARGILKTRPRLHPVHNS